MRPPFFPFFPFAADMPPPFFLSPIVIVYPRPAAPRGGAAETG